MLQAMDRALTLLVCMETRRTSGVFPSPVKRRVGVQDDDDGDLLMRVALTRPKA